MSVANEKFREALREAMRRERLSYADLADLIGRSKSGVEHWLLGEAVPSRRLFDHLALVFPELPEPDISVDEPTVGPGVPVDETRRRDSKASSLRRRRRRHKLTAVVAAGVINFVRHFVEA